MLGLIVLFDAVCMYLGCSALHVRVLAVGDFVGVWKYVMCDVCVRLVQCACAWVWRELLRRPARGCVGRYVCCVCEWYFSW